MLDSNQDAVGRMQPAVPGSYGWAPSGFRLPNAIQLGPVRLQVADLERSVEYYTRVIGLQVLRRDDQRTMLGAPSNTELVELRERKGARPFPRRRTGLFHFALLLPDRASLGRFVKHLREIGVNAGSADHLVSEALYLHDPDNLGIEIYADRPRSQWRRSGRELVLVSDPLDIASLLQAGGAEPWTGVPAGTTMGHVHLHVGDLDRAEEFFSQTLGFDGMAREYPGALFLGAGGYHHHLGTNTWAGRHASPPTADEAQLLAWTIRLPDRRSLAALAESLETRGHSFERGSDNGECIRARDPWGTVVRLQTTSNGPSS